MSERLDLRAQLDDAVDVNDQLAAVAALRSRAAELRDDGMTQCRLAVLTGYTSTLLTDLVFGHAWLRGVKLETMESGFGLFEQVLLAEDPAFSAWKPDVVYFCVGLEHFALDSVDAEVARWKRLWEKARALYGCDVVMNTVVEPRYRTYGNYELKVEGSVGRKVAELNLALAREAPSYVHLHDVSFLASNLGKDQMFDPKWHAVAKLPANLACLPAYAKSVAGVIAAIRGKSKKCLVLDLDDTLWGGVVGDDGVDGVRLGAESAEGESFVRFQTYVKSLAARGVLLAVCSKNDDAIARAVFTQRPEMVLTLTDISAFVANWEPKDQGLRAIAAALNVLPESMVFVDDSPAECALVRSRMPEVAVVELPRDPSRYCEALAAHAFFEPIAISNEDRQRAASFQAEGARAALAGESASYADYLASLKMETTIRAWRPDESPRVTQLLAKTNQFNLTGRRYTDPQVRALLDDADVVPLCLDLRDRFGDYGLVSVLIGRCSGDVCAIECWVMSCRVFKRGVEETMFAHVRAELARRGVRTVRGTLVPTPRNGYVTDLFASLGFTREHGDSDHEQRWELPLSEEQA